VCVCVCMSVYVCGVCVCVCVVCMCVCVTRWGGLNLLETLSYAESEVARQGSRPY